MIKAATHNNKNSKKLFVIIGMKTKNSPVNPAKSGIDALEIKLKKAKIDINGADVATRL